MADSINTITLDVAGINSKAMIADYSAGSIYSQYLQAINILKTFVASDPDENGERTGILVDPAVLRAQIVTLMNLLRYGMEQHVDPNDPNSPLKRYYLTHKQAEQLTLFFQSLALAGINVQDPNFEVTLVNANVWQTIISQNYDFQDGTSQKLLDPLFNSIDVNPNTSIQAFIELEYVKSGNDLLSQELSGLQTAVSTTNNVLNALADLQDLHNRITVVNKPPFKFVSTGLTPSQYLSAYRKAASAYYATPVVPTFDTNLFPPSAYAVTVEKKENTGGTWAFDGFGDGTAAGSGYLQYTEKKKDFDKFQDGANGTYGVILAIPTANTDSLGRTLWDIYQKQVPDDTPPLFFKNRLISQFGGDDDPTHFITSNTPLDSLRPFTIIYKPNASAFKTDFNAFTIHDYNDVMQNSILTLWQPNVDANGDPIRTDGNLSSFSQVPSFNGLNIVAINSSISPRQSVTYAADGVSIRTQSSIFTEHSFWADINQFHKLSTNNPLTKFTTASGGSAEFLQGFVNVSQDVVNAINYFRAPPSGTGKALATWLGNGVADKIRLLQSGDQFLKYDTSLQKLFVLSGTGAIDLVKSIVKLRMAISGYIKTLSALNPTSDSSSLLSRLKTVYSDLVNNFKTSTGAQITETTILASALRGLSTWLLDGYLNRTSTDTTQSNQAGIIQQNITFAITAGQSLNDSQKEKVRNFLFVFEEYYKSASAVLQKLTQILERVAQGISR